MRREISSVTYAASQSISAAATPTEVQYAGASGLLVACQVTVASGTGVGIQFFVEGSVNPDEGVNWGQLKDAYGTAASTASLTASHATNTLALFQLKEVPTYTRVRHALVSAGAGSYVTFNVYGEVQAEAA